MGAGEPIRLVASRCGTIVGLLVLVVAGCSPSSKYRSAQPGSLALSYVDGREVLVHGDDHTAVGWAGSGLIRVVGNSALALSEARDVRKYAITARVLELLGYGCFGGTVSVAARAGEVRGLGVALGCVLLFFAADEYRDAARAKLHSSIAIFNSSSKHEHGGKAGVFVPCDARSNRARLFSFDYGGFVRSVRACTKDTQGSVGASE